MGYHEGLRKYFKSKGEKQVNAATKMNYKPSMFSQYLNGKEINMEFLSRFIKAYPDADLNMIFKNEENVYPEVNEPSVVYHSDPATIIDEIQQKLELLKGRVTRS
jgi:hypothetical protein